MNTFKKVEEYENIKKGIFIITVLLVVLDIVCGFTSSLYRTSMRSLVGVGFAVHSLLKEYADYQVMNKEMSKMIVVLSIVIIGFSLYHIFLNVINMSGAVV